MTGRMIIKNTKTNEILGGVLVGGKTICLDEALKLLDIKVAQSAEDERNGLPCWEDLQLGYED